MDNFPNGLLLLFKLIQYLDFCAFKGLQIKTSLSEECVFAAALEHVWNPKFMALKALALFQMFLIRERVVIYTSGDTELLSKNVVWLLKKASIGGPDFGEGKKKAAVVSLRFKH